MGCYDPGTKTMARKIGENRYALDSFRGAPVTYEVNLTPGQVCCSCPHYQSRLIGTDAQCKHICTCIEQRDWIEAAAKAEQLADTDIQRLLPKYGTDVVIGGCLRAERARRKQEVVAAQPRPIPAGVLALLDGATEAEKARCLEIYR